MASLVGAFAASHGPLIVREWENVPPEQKQRMSEGFRELGRRIAAAKVDVLIAVSPDHWSNFFLDNMPAICIGVGEVNEGPPEPWMKAFPHREIAPPEGFRPGNIGFGRGADAGSLYVTTLFQWRFFRMDTNRRGHYWQ